MSILFYRRPDFIKREDGPLEKSSCQKYVDRNASSIKPPEALSFDNVINKKTLPPVTLGDFMDYTMYISHDAENLQFYLWYRDYVKRFESLPDSDKALSPEWYFDHQRPSPGGWPLASAESDLNSSSDKCSTKVQQEQIPQRPIVRIPSRATTRPTPYVTDYNLNIITDLNSFPNPPRPVMLSNAPTEDNASEACSLTFSNTATEDNRADYSSQMAATAANAQVGLKWQGFDIQPFRSEITRVISHYLANSSPRALNISHSTRSSLLHALQHTTHPSAFTPAIDLIEIHLRHHAHPNFIRWTICNGNAPRVFFVRWMGVITTLQGFLVAILLTLSKANRWWRLFAAIPWMIGITTLIAAYKGLCVILHLTHGRTLKPWEDPAAVYGTFDSEQGDELTRPYSHSHFEEKFRDSNELNAYTPPEPASPIESRIPDEDWRSRYNRRPLLRKIFDNSVVVQEHAVRIIQDKIVRMSQLWALIWTIIFCIVFVAVPKGNFY